jgi:DNA polymerase III delta prime subunit
MINSLEQNILISWINVRNVCVSAVPGSGKTTSALCIAKQYSRKKILLLTYSRSLKEETDEKIKKEKIKNMEVRSFHSFYVRYYGTSYTDTKLRELLEKNTQPKDRKKFRYDIIIIDECQDMTDLYFEAVIKILRNSEPNYKICILGDQHQAVFCFKGSDNRFLTMANEIFNVNEFKWISLGLSRSFRLSREICDFVNYCVVKKQLICSEKSTKIKPRYVVCNVFGKMKFIHDEIITHLKNGYLPGDILLLGNSLKNGTPVHNTYLQFCKSDYPVYYRDSSKETCKGNKVMNNKIAFLTFCGAKGLERKIVYVFNFDEGLSYNKNLTACPHSHYVAITRASEKLIVIHHVKEKKLNFIDSNNVKKYCDIFRENEKKHLEQIDDLDSALKLKTSTTSPAPTRNLPKNVSVLGLLQYIDPQTLNSCVRRLKFKSINCAKTKIEIEPNTHQQYKGFNIYETVSNITGEMVNLYAEFLNTKTIESVKNFKNCLVEKHTKKLQILWFEKLLNEKLAEISYQGEKTVNVFCLREKLLEISNIYIAARNITPHTINQISNYSWFPEKEFKKLEKRIVSTKCISFENSISCKYPKYADSSLVGCKFSGETKLSGIVDQICGDVLTEIKFVSVIDHEHILQLLLYAYIIDCAGSFRNIKKYILHNVRTDEKIELFYNSEVADEIVNDLFDSKYNDKKINDEHFLLNADAIKYQYFDDREDGETEDNDSEDDDSEDEEEVFDLDDIYSDSE